MTWASSDKDTDITCVDSGESTADTFDPHFLQNRASSGKNAPQNSQYIDFTPLLFSVMRQSRFHLPDQPIIIRIARHFSCATSRSSRYDKVFLPFFVIQ